MATPVIGKFFHRAQSVDAVVNGVGNFALAEEIVFDAHAGLPFASLI